jgi:hypothetical protein
MVFAEAILSHICVVLHLQCITSHTPSPVPLPTLTRSRSQAKPATVLSIFIKSSLLLCSEGVLRNSKLKWLYFLNVCGSHGLNSIFVFSFFFSEGKENVMLCRTDLIQLKACRAVQP